MSFKNFFFGCKYLKARKSFKAFLCFSSQWVIAGCGDPPLHEPNIFPHHNSPALGHFWNSQAAIIFDRIKLTNNRVSSMDGQVI